MDKKTIGDKGESFAAAFYEKSGYSVVKRNYHSRYGEIDLIAENETEVCFVEVKTRNLSALGNPAEAVDYRKQKKMTLTAMKYLGESECFKQPRFDVLEVWQEEGRIVKYNLIENAFYADDFAGNYEMF